jgi:hypothetical protein
LRVPLNVYLLEKFLDVLRRLEPTFAPFFFDRLADPILTAVDDNCRPSNKCSLIARQKKSGTGDIFKFPETLDGLLLPRGAFFPF